ncbi:hypothetical protein LNAOJCKE_0894 [Methylorubrum aminovorans]|uniref:Uncharacterized protein n=1 Tax=Methylorubrum aminovorans TaxID=269069 RepID=A0ABQ4UA84_9HYPH|nr:hypothetical protein [Methylorubrum aminovorans]GJE63696.1 hypothetical protein LNAOJCKE_0894 [Methylorubrum aminovorans]GMA73627.1 hypothetical protein GCM10025880_00440 [Methylorubrum aminovorans]GMA79813.1 hypothetical protein GCM10025880_62300 [Methylorubrum aminovorans]
MTTAATLEPLEQAHRILREHLHVISPNGSLHYVGGIQEAAEAIAPILTALATATAEAASLRAERDDLARKLTEAAEAADAPWSGYSTYQTSIDNEEAGNLRRCREIVRAARTALARAATAGEG